MALPLVACLVGSPSASTQPDQSHRVLAYGKVGGLLPLDDLGPHMAVRVGLGYVPPLWRGRVGLIADVGLSRTTTHGAAEDPRLGQDGGSYSFDVGQLDVDLFIGPLVFIRDPRRAVVPYAAAGFALHFVTTRVEGRANGQPLGANDELSTAPGFAVRAGVGYRLGPGLVTAELGGGWAPLDHSITGDSHLGRLALLLGYTGLLSFR